MLFTLLCKPLNRYVQTFLSLKRRDSRLKEFKEKRKIKILSLSNFRQTFSATFFQALHFSGKFVLFDSVLFKNETFK